MACNVCGVFNGHSIECERLRAEVAELKRRVRLARDVVKSRAFIEQGWYREELNDLLDLRRPLLKRAATKRGRKRPTHDAGCVCRACRKATQLAAKESGF